MNYYERHLGDYARDTGHLSMLEHGAYTLLMDRYYATEEGIPQDQAYRFAHAKSMAERAAVDAVLLEFFTLTDGYWRKARIDQEIEAARVRIRTARANGKLGGRPKSATDAPIEKPAGFLLGTPSQTQQKAHQAPSSKLQAEQEQEQDQKQKPPPAAPAAVRPVAKIPPIPEWIDPEAWAGFVAMRQRERHPLTPRAVKLILAELDRFRLAGIDPAAILDQSTRNNWRDVYPLKPSAARVAEPRRPSERPL